MIVTIVCQNIDLNKMTKNGADVLDMGKTKKPTWEEIYWETASYWTKLKLLDA